MKTVQRINVSKEVHRRLKAFGNTYKQRVDALLAQDVIVDPEKVVKSKYIEGTKPVYVSIKAYQDLSKARDVLKCSSISTVIETLLNSDPATPAYVDNGRATSTLRVREQDHDRLRELAEDYGINLQEAMHMLLDFFQEKADQ